RDHVVVVRDRDHVVAVGGIDDDRIGRTIAAGAAGLCAEVDGDLAHAGSGQIVDRDGVGVIQGVDLNALDAVEVHGDGADVAGDDAGGAPRGPAVGGDVDLLADVGAVEAQRVGARLALDRVAGVTRVPNERVVARAEQRQVVASAADDDVVALAAGDGVVAG